MSRHVCTLAWQREADAAFLDHRYSRSHEWVFDGGASVLASVSPHIVPPPYADARCVDPEEAFVAALASCHMLFALHLAAVRGWVVDAYTDDAVGDLVRDGDGHRWMAAVRLNPVMTFQGGGSGVGPGVSPGIEEVRALHADAHGQCFLARSVTSAIRIDLARQIAHWRRAAGCD